MCSSAPVLCACGCGGQLPAHRGPGQPRKYLLGHRYRGSVERVCETCGVAFLSRTSANRRFCSRPCYMAVRLKETTRTCQWCGIVFTARSPSSGPRVYCSRKCYKAMARADTARRVECICAQCGAAFVRDLSHKGRFCSYACSYAAQRGTTRPHKLVLWTCQGCGASVLGPPHAARHRRYCSLSCAARTRQRNKDRPQVELTCRACGRTFTVSANDKHALRRRYCNRECMHYGLHDTRRRGKTSVLERIIEGVLIAMEIAHVPQWRFVAGVADFYLPEFHKAIECDGDYWHKLPKAVQRDMVKEKGYRALGIPVLHLTETEIMTDIAGCHRRLREFVGRAPPPSPT